VSVLVSDALVLFDLKRPSVLEGMFLLPFEFAVQLGLKVETLTSGELRRASLVSRKAQLSRMCPNGNSPAPRRSAQHPRISVEHDRIALGRFHHQT
jgi:hypothetical protein